MLTTQKQQMLRWQFIHVVSILLVHSCCQIHVEDSRRYQGHKLSTIKRIFSVLCACYLQRLKFEFETRYCQVLNKTYLAQCGRSRWWAQGGWVCGVAPGRRPWVDRVLDSRSQRVDAGQTLGATLKRQKRSTKDVTLLVDIIVYLLGNRPRDRKSNTIVFNKCFQTCD